MSDKMRDKIESIKYEIDSSDSENILNLIDQEFDEKIEHIQEDDPNIYPMF